jgi:hypothetical protein
MARTEEEHQQWLARNGPIVVAVAAIVAFAIIKYAGHSTGISFLVALIMGTFALAIVKLRQWFSPAIGATIMFGAAFFLWWISSSDSAVPAGGV